MTRMIRRAMQVSVLFVLVVAAAGIVYGQTYSIPVGSGTLTYSITLSTSSCPIGPASGGPPPMGTLTVSGYGSFSYVVAGVATSLSGGGAYLSSPGGSYGCPASGWTSAIPWLLTGGGYVISFNPSLGTATISYTATPTFSPAAGTYTSTQTVTISDATAGAIIYYTTNGTVPTTSSSVYSSSIVVSSTQTVEALAVASGYSNSAVASALYTINTTAATPTFSPAGGAYSSAQTVTISDATSGATIYYTTDGTTPTTSSSVYSSPITVSPTETVKALAVKSGYSNSPVGIATYSSPLPIQLPGAGIINTLAGNGTSGYAGDGGLATGAPLSAPSGIAVDASGNLYIADSSNQRIRKVAASTGVITTVAGNGVAGYSGDGGLATSAELYNPRAVAIDSSGNIYIVDISNNRVRKVTASTGIITTVAGNGTPGYSGDGALATGAELQGPYGVAVDAVGNIYIADTGNMRIRKVSISTGYISTLAGNGTEAYLGDGGLATSAELDAPLGIAVDSSGNIYIDEIASGRIRKITVSTGIISTVAGGGTSGSPCSAGLATSAELAGPEGIAVDGAGNIYIAQIGYSTVCKVTASTGAIAIVAGNGTAGYSGDGGIATSAALSSPDAVAVDSSGNIYIADTSNQRIRAVGSTKLAQTISFTAPTTPVTYGVAPIALVATASSGLAVSYSITAGLCSVSGSSLTITGAGTCTVAANQAGNGSYGPATQVTQSVVVNKATLTVTANASRAYGAANPTFTPSYSGFVNGDTASVLTGTPSLTTTATVSSAVGSYAITVAAGTLAATNYSFSFVNGTLTVGKAVLTVTANASRAYGAANPTFTPSYSGFLNGDTSTVLTGTPSLTTTATASSPLGTYTITVAAGTLAATNYSFSFVNGTLTVGKAVLTVTANASRAYGAANPTFTPSYSGFVNGDTSAVLTGTPSLTTTATVSSAAGSYAITVAAGTLAATNYSFSFVNGTLTVNKAVLTVTATNASRAYGVANPAFVASYSGFLNGDTSAVLTGTPSLTTTATASSAPGTYTITAAAGTLAATNYSFTFVNGSLTIGQTVLTVTANNASRIYGVPNPPLTVSYSGFINGDTSAVLSGAPSLTTTAGILSPIGTYSITPTIGTLSAANYTFTFINGNLNVVKNAIVFPSLGNINTVVGTGTGSFAGDGGLATSANVNYPMSVAVDTYGNLYIVDYDNSRIRKVTAATGDISTVAGGGTVCAQATDTLGDGCLATNALFNHPEGVALDSSGNIYIADTFNYRIREVNATTGIITTIAGNGTLGFSGDGLLATASTVELYLPTGVAVDAAKNIYIADFGNMRIRMISGTTGIITTVVGSSVASSTGDGGPASKATLHNPSGVALDSFGNLYIAESVGDRIRKVTAPIPSGTISTVAGNGSAGYSGDGGAATSATLNLPTNIAVDLDGYLYFTDRSNCVVRRVTLATGLISTVAGDVTTPGTVTCGYSGDGALATSAELNSPVGIAVDSFGNFYVGDGVNNRIRAVIPSTPQVIVWNSPTPITYGTALSPTQLNAQVNNLNNQLVTCPLSTAPDPTVPGTCTYTPATGVLAAGPQVLTVTFTPSAAYSTTYAPVQNSVILNVNQAIPVVTWSKPAAIADTTKLTTASQLNAVITDPLTGLALAGTSVYTNAAGAVLTSGVSTLNAGNQLLTVTFTPASAIAANYTTATATVSLTVTGAAHDTGTVTLYVNGSTTPSASYTYGASDTPSSIAEALAVNASSTLVSVASVQDVLYLSATPAAVTQYGGAATDFAYSLVVADTAGFSPASFAVTPASGYLDGGANVNAVGATVYSYKESYDPAGNLASTTDSVMGIWSYTYDTLNRLSTGTAASASADTAAGVAAPYASNFGCWSYDDFGNRLSQAVSTVACTSNPTPTTWAHYNSNNQITGTPQAPGGLTYDSSGDVT
ncbi:MAG: MBG domain-containing protein, partial [Terracidiphilus sp.]